MVFLEGRGGETSGVLSLVSTDGHTGLVGNGHDESACDGLFLFLKLRDLTFEIAKLTVVSGVELLDVVNIDGSGRYVLQYVVHPEVFGFGRNRLDDVMVHVEVLTADQHGNVERLDARDRYVSLNLGLVVERYLVLGDNVTGDDLIFLRRALVIRHVLISCLVFKAVSVESIRPASLALSSSRTVTRLAISGLITARSRFPRIHLFSPLVSMRYTFMPVRA